jgi:dephospho-CoA kinase
MLIPVVPYQARWTEDFQAFARKLNNAFGREALRIDHIGSTAVEGLAAKSVIDIQVTVASLSVVSGLVARVVDQGFVQQKAIDRDRPLRMHGLETPIALSKRGLRRR